MTWLVLPGSYCKPINKSAVYGRKFLQNNLSWHTSLLTWENSFADQWFTLEDSLLDSWHAASTHPELYYVLCDHKLCWNPVNSLPEKAQPKEPGHGPLNPVKTPPNPLCLDIDRPRPWQCLLLTVSWMNLALLYQQAFLTKILQPRIDTGNQVWFSWRQEASKCELLYTYNPPGWGNQ